MKKSRTYPWAVINSSGKLMRESNDRRTIYRTREAARTAARTLNGKVVRRSDMVLIPAAPAPIESQTI